MIKSSKSFNGSYKTIGVETLLGDPKKAVIKLAIPMIIAMSVQTIYNFVDALWVSGFGSEFFVSFPVEEIGKNALAAIGFVLPFFMMIIAISTGIGVGSASAISRRIGAKDKAGADNIAIHSIIITFLISIIFSIILFVFADIIFSSIGAGVSLDMAISYGRVIFAFSFVIFFINIATAILRGEGDAKRSMYALMFGAGINIVLDPIFIYNFGLGVTGAAYATILSMGLTCILLSYWLFFRKDTYVDFHFRYFRFKKDIIKDIFRVGLPASFQQLSMSITMIILIVIITGFTNAGDNGVAIYQTGWRVVLLAVLPLLGMATAVISVCGAAYGAKDYKKLDIAYMFAVKLGLIIEFFIAFIIFFLAPFIAGIFTTAENAGVITNDLEIFIRITVWFYPAAALGIMSSAMFQGSAKGNYSLVATLIRTLLLTIVLAFVFSTIFEPAIIGVWWGIVVANLIGSMISFVWGKYFVYSLLRSNSLNKN